MTVKKDGDFALIRESLYGITNEPTYAGANSFMRRKYTRDLEGVDLVVTGVPLDTATTNRPGARFGPRGIRAASASIAWMRPYDTEVDPFEKLAVIDYGDCFFDFGRPEGVPDAIEAHASSIIEKGPGLLTLGGDHFIAWPLLKAHAKKHGKPLSLLAAAQGACEEARQAVIAIAFRCAQRHLGRRRRACRSRHDVVARGERRPHRSRAFGTDRPAHDQ
jgi:agmatinase